MDADPIRSLLAPLGTGVVGIALAWAVIRIGYAIVSRTIKLAAFVMLTFLTVFALGVTFVAWSVMRRPEALRLLLDGDVARALAP